VFLDPIGRWIAATTGRTLDQHAADPIPAATQLPDTANLLRHDRNALLLAVDTLRTTLINADDLTVSGSAVTDEISKIAELGYSYRDTRGQIDALLKDTARARYAQENPAQPVRRRYVNPGDTVMVVLPHTDSNRESRVAGLLVQLRVDLFDAEISPAEPFAAGRLSCADAGIYHDPTDPEPGCYVLQRASNRTSGR
jgi:hypothetical protein